MDNDNCPKCGSADRAIGRIFPAGTSDDIRFLADDASLLSFKKEISALACGQCGYLELYLDDAG